MSLTDVYVFQISPNVEAVIFLLTMIFCLRYGIEVLG